jgi:hypothetical protein
MRAEVYQCSWIRKLELLNNYKCLYMLPLHRCQPNKPAVISGVEAGCDI